MKYLKWKIVLLQQIPNSAQEKKKVEFDLGITLQTLHVSFSRIGTYK